MSLPSIAKLSTLEIVDIANWGEVLERKIPVE